MGAYPSQTSLAVLRAACYRAMGHSRQRPTAHALAAALVGLCIDTPFGPLEMQSDHNATYHGQYGISVHVPRCRFAVFNRIVDCPADLVVIAPVGTTAEAWNASLKRDDPSRVPEAVVYPRRPDILVTRRRMPSISAGRVPVPPGARPAAPRAAT